MRFSLLILVTLTAAAAAQSRPQSDPDQPAILSESSEVPTVPGLTTGLHGFNGGLSLTSVHDSQVGWYTLITPALSYDFPHRLSVDISMPVYLFRLAETSVTTQPPTPPYGQPQPPVTTTELQPRTWDPGDIILASHATLLKLHIVDIFTPSMTLPSGDSNYGLSTGRVTFDLDNHLQLNTPGPAFIVDIGGGDSSNLVNRLVNQNYTSLGPLAHFQAGLSVSLPLRSLFTSVAYEELPLGDSKIYTTVTRPGFPPQSVVSGRSVSEDNGFTNLLVIPLTRRLTLQGYYNRSLRLHLDTVAMSVTYVVRGPAKLKPPPPNLDQLFGK